MEPTQAQLHDSVNQRRLAHLASVIANPTSAPVLAKMVAKRNSNLPVEAGGAAAHSAAATRMRMTKGNLRPRGKSLCRVGKYSNAATTLWMTRRRSPTPHDYDDDDDDDNTSEGHPQRAPLSCQASQTRLMDLQTNNSKKKGSPLSRGEASTLASTAAADEVTPTPTDTSDYELVSEDSEIKNKSAAAKGADAMVTNSLSRQTVIIDTSKLDEGGKVETEFHDEPEDIKDQDYAMVDEYEKGFAYARRMRALLNMQFKEMDRGTIDTNFLLVKAHDHPTQKMIDRWRKVDNGVSYNDQVKRQKLIEYFRLNAVKNKTKDEAVPIYPEMIRFTVRFRKDNSEKRWMDYLTFRQKQKKQMGRAFHGVVPKPNDKYTLAFLDVWSFCVVAFVKPSATVREIIDPVLARLGLERRADFVYTIGCFCNDKRAGKATIMGVPAMPQPLQIYQLASDLYKSNCTEIYVNDNRYEMFSIFPDFYEREMPKKAGEETKPMAVNKKSKNYKDGKKSMKEDKREEGKVANKKANAAANKSKANRTNSFTAASVVRAEEAAAALPEDPERRRLLSTQDDEFSSMG